MGIRGAGGGGVCVCVWRRGGRAVLLFAEGKKEKKGCGAPPPCRGPEQLGL